MAEIWPRDNCDIVEIDQRFVQDMATVRMVK